MVMQGGPDMSRKGPHADAGMKIFGSLTVRVENSDDFLLAALGD
jgi:hypothetical protein